jgi:hypothetical protein
MARRGIHPSTGKVKSLRECLPSMDGVREFLDDWVADRRGLNANKIVKLVSALVLFAIAMAFRRDVTEVWLRALLAVLAFGLLAWGIAQMFLNRKL